MLLLKKSDQRNWRWLQVVPLFHFLTGLSVPYQTIPVKSEDIKWNFWIELETTRKKQHSNSQRFCDYIFIDCYYYYCYYQYLYSYKEALVYVQDLMELDYVFTKVMLYMCPHKDLSTVLSSCDPVLANSFYIWYLDDHGKEFVIKAKDSEVIMHVAVIHSYLWRDGCVKCNDVVECALLVCVLCQLFKLLYSELS